MGAPGDATGAPANAPLTNGGEEADGDTDEGFEDDAEGPEVVTAEPAHVEAAPVHDAAPAQPEPVAHHDDAAASSPVQAPPIEPSEG